MSNPKGHIPAEKLDDLLHSVMEWADHAQLDEASENEGSPQNQSVTNNKFPKGTNMSKKRPFFSNFGNIVTSLVSAIALIFSGYSFYETVLKEAQLKIYTPALVHMYRSGYRDVLAIPLTISNDGAKRGTILSVDLEVTNTDTGESKKFENLYFGNNPKDTSRIFTPLTMSGRSSKSEVIMFFADKPGAFFKTTGGVKSNLQFKMKINADESEYLFKPKEQPSIIFNMRATFIQSFRAMEKGIPTVYYKNKTAPTNKNEKTPATKDTEKKAEDKTTDTPAKDPSENNSTEN